MKQSAEPASVAEMEQPVVTEKTTVVPETSSSAVPGGDSPASTAIAASALSADYRRGDAECAKPVGAAGDQTTAPTVETLRRGGDRGSGGCGACIGCAVARRGRLDSRWFQACASKLPSMGKKMLSLTVNAAAEKIMRQETAAAGRAFPFSDRAR